MTEYKKNHENIELDAILVHAAANGMIMPAAVMLKMSPNDVTERADWLRSKQPEYIDRVAARVIELEAT